MNDTLVYWRKSNNSLSSDRIQKIFDAFRLYNKYENFNFFSSIYLTLRLSIYYLFKKTLQKTNL